MKRFFKSLQAVLMVCFILSPAPVCALTDIINIRHWTAPDNTRIVIDTGSEASFAVHEEDQKLIVEIFDSELMPDVSMEYPIAMPAVSRVLVLPLPNNTVRVEIEISKEVAAEVFKLGEILDKPHRIVIDVKIPAVEQREADERARASVDERKKIIVLDPGHGGEDPGAIGRLGTREKDIVLKIARELRELLVERGYKVFLTRDGDYFVSLMQRGKIARQYNADLFVSIHADAAPVRYVRGSSVYCLSTIGASNEASRLLAASQNLSDIIGGDPGSHNNDETDPIILNMLQTESLNQSRSFGSITLEKMKRVNGLKFKTVQGAPFRVLKLPDITSVLVETAYLSNPQEELQLRDKAFRSDIAWAIAAAVTEYLPTQYAADFREQDAQYRPQHRATVQAERDIIYRVQRGDHLERIAAKHGTTVRALMETNNIKSRDRIFVGQTLRIQGGYALEQPESAPAIYTVAPGDSLERVARRYGVSVDDLMRVNNIRSKNRIYIGQRLVLSDVSSSCSSTPTTHEVVRGDTLEQIAHQYGLTVKELMRLNDIQSKNRIYVGQSLALSGAASSSTTKPVTHVVARGDTLEQISRRYGVTVNELMRINHISSKDRIFIGQHLAMSVPTSVTPASGKPVQLLRPKEHVVVRGDTLEQIARRYGVTVEELTRVNDISSRDRIYVGQRMALSTASIEAAPPLQPVTHVVARGDSLGRIARRYGVTVEDLLQVNSFRSKDVIQVGQKVRIPSGVARDSGSSGTNEKIYIVDRGDTLETIANRFGTTIESLMATNSLESRHRIFAGQELTISR